VKQAANTRVLCYSWCQAETREWERFRCVYIGVNAYLRSLFHTQAKRTQHNFIQSTFDSY